MKIAWLAPERDFQNPGGAEQADADMLSVRPEGVEVDMMLAWPETDLSEYDRVVVSSLRGLTAQQVGQLAFLSPVIWAHDMEFAGHWLYAKANPLITLTPTHREFEMSANSRLKNVKVNPGYMDLSQIPLPSVTRANALWAHRLVDHKGLDRAQQWSAEKHIPLDVMVGQPRHNVLAAMGSHQYFVLLSKIFDPGPRAVMEAQLMGCELVLDNVGYFEDPLQLREEIATAGEAFWEVVGCE